MSFFYSFFFFDAQLNFIFLMRSSVYFFDAQLWFFFLFLDAWSFSHF